MFPKQPLTPNEAGEPGHQQTPLQCQMWDRPSEEPKQTPPRHKEEVEIGRENSKNLSSIKQDASQASNQGREF